MVEGQGEVKSRVIPLPDCRSPPRGQSLRVALRTEATFARTVEGF
jgi:hypothetical protein